MANKYNATTHKIKQKELNVPNLLRTKALRITEPGPGVKEKSSPKDPKQFSVVTPKNPQAKTWKDKPASVATATRLFKKGWLDDGKYKQIVDSARAKGMADSEIFKKARPK